MTGKRKARYGRNTFDRSQTQRAKRALAAKVTTSQRGYGWPYQQRRARALAALVDGEPCWRCGRPMYKTQQLDFDHIVPLALGGGGERLAHRACNRRAGQALGSRLRAQQPARRAPRRARYTRW